MCFFKRIDVTWRLCEVFGDFHNASTSIYLATLRHHVAPSTQHYTTAEVVTCLPTTITATSHFVTPDSDKIIKDLHAVSNYKKR